MTSQKLIGDNIRLYHGQEVRVKLDEDGEIEPLLSTNRTQIQYNIKGRRVRTVVNIDELKPMPKPTLSKNGFPQI